MTNFKMTVEEAERLYQIATATLKVTDALKAAEAYRDLHEKTHYNLDRTERILNKRDRQFHELAKLLTGQEVDEGQFVGEAFRAACKLRGLPEREGPE